jgi:hypothetical protein
MPKNKKAGQTSATKKLPTLEMIIALAGFIAGMLAKLSFEQVQHLLTNKNTVLRKKLLEVFEITKDEFAEVRVEWEKFYLDNFGITTDFSSVVIPPKPIEGYWRLIFVAQGITMNSTLAVMRTLFQVGVYTDDPDKDVTVNTRTSVMGYATWVRKGVEPDKKYLNKSTHQVDPDGKIGITFLERMILEIRYFLETGSNLDVRGITLCTGSRYSDGDVPNMYFNPHTDEVRLDAYDTNDAGSDLGLREAVAL